MCPLRVVALSAALFAFDAAAPAKVKRATAADSVKIVYDIQGKGEPTLLFVHCWACDRTFWKDQAGEFALKHRVIAVDLGGHGQSGANRKQWSIAGLAGDVEAVVKAEKLKRVILIGHSMGGPVSLAAAARMVGAVEAVILIDTLHNVEMTFPVEAAKTMTERLDADFGNTMEQAVRGMFGAGAESPVANWIVAKSRSARKDVATALFRDFPNIDLKALLAGAKTPVRAINAAPPAAIPTAADINRKYADFAAVTIEGVGHFLNLERPLAFNAVLARVIASVSLR
jgi:pimeloyl-ACP methyl ester carboxylesterase